MTQTQRHYPNKPTDVYMFATCLIDQFEPEAGMDAIRLLEREGVQVHFPTGQTCCGQPAFSSGYPDEARAVALHQLALFENDWPVVVPSGSCAAMMRTHYPHLFAEDEVWRVRANALAERVFELTEFLCHVLHFDRLDQGELCTVALHTSCHARRQMQVHETSAALLNGLGQVQVREPARVQECCGFGGTFSLLHPEISEAIVTDKVSSLRETGAKTVISADCGCLLNIAGRSARLDELAQAKEPSLRSEHIASFLWKRTGAQG